MDMTTSNIKKGSFLFKNNENTYPKGSLMQMYRVVPQTKRGNWHNCEMHLTDCMTNTDGIL